MAWWRHANCRGFLSYELRGPGSEAAQRHLTAWRVVSLSPGFSCVRSVPVVAQPWSEDQAPADSKPEADTRPTGRPSTAGASKQRSSSRPKSSPAWKVNNEKPPFSLLIHRLTGFTCPSRHVVLCFCMFVL